jgi:ATP-binding protein involved in chromosome partitioning
MIRKLNLNVLGIVENYTGEIFGEGAGKVLAQDVEAPFLGTIALRSSYQDNSRPTALVDEAVGDEYVRLAEEVKKSLRELGREAA